MSTELDTGRSTYVVLLGAFAIHDFWSLNDVLWRDVWVTFDRFWEELSATIQIKRYLDILRAMP
jgi:hypothetical protein